MFYRGEVYNEQMRQHLVNLIQRELDIGANNIAYANKGDAMYDAYYEQEQADMKCLEWLQEIEL